MNPKMHPIWQIPAGVFSSLYVFSQYFKERFYLYVLTFHEMLQMNVIFLM